MNTIANKALKTIIFATSALFITNTASAVTVEEIMIEKENFMYYAEQGDSSKLDKLNAWLEFARSGGAKSDFAEVYITGTKTVEELIAVEPEAVYKAELDRIEGLRIAEEQRIAAEAQAKFEQEQQLIAEKRAKIEATEKMEMIANISAFVVLSVLMLVFYKFSFIPYIFVTQKIGSIYNIGVSYDKATMSKHQKFRKSQLDMTLSNIGMGISFISIAYIVVSVPYVALFFAIKEYVVMPLL